MPTLSWLTREADIRVTSQIAYRLLEEVAEYSSVESDSGNMLIQGDNLETLQALLPFYAGSVKCIYIDPPYNTQSAFEHYDDNLEHTQWLAMMWPRLELLQRLLAEDGSIWIQLDDHEAHYARVMLDEIFGRRNFVADISWQKSYAVRSNAEFVSASVEHIFWYCQNRKLFSPNKIPRTEQQRARFRNPDKDPRGLWQSVAFTISLMSGARGRQYAKTGVSANLYDVTSPSGMSISPPTGRCWARTEAAFQQLDADGRIWWGPNGDRVPRLKMFLQEADEGVLPTTLWASGDDYGFNQDGIRELRALGLTFPTPKPERLIQRIIEIGTDPGDLILDSFLGSGTTAAVSHKMGRRWIGIEMGEHALTHCAPRMRKVIAGEQGGISERVGWNGGGGFRFYKLGPTAFDENGRICSDIGFPILAAHIWFSETGMPWIGHKGCPVLGIHDGRAIALLYNGVIGDKRPRGGNVLTGATLKLLRDEVTKAEQGFDGPLIVYGEQTRLASDTLEREYIIFKQTPYDIKS